MSSNNIPLLSWLYLCLDFFLASLYLWCGVLHERQGRRDRASISGVVQIFGLLGVHDWTGWHGQLDKKPLTQVNNWPNSPELKRRNGLYFAYLGDIPLILVWDTLRGE